MPDLSQDQFDRLSAVLGDPEKVSQMSAEVRAKAESAVSAYKAKASGVVDRLDPGLPLLAQAQSFQPATNHPKSDLAAADDWERNPDATNGSVVVYDMPLAVARKKLLENPSLIPALGYVHGPPSLDEIQSMGADSDLYKSYNDYVWRQTADAATKAGKGAYRYSKAPWLQEGGLMEKLGGLGKKLQASALPALEGVSAFVMGVDDTATFGGLRAAQEATDGPDAEERPPKPPGDYSWHPTLGWVPGKPSGDEVVGGALATAAAEGGGAKEANEMMAEDHPILHTAGQVVGAVPGLASGAVKGAGKLIGTVSEATGKSIQAVGRGLEHLAPWSASNEAFDLIASGGKRALAKLGLTEGLAPVTASLVSGGLAGAGVHAVQEGVDAAANAYRTGDPGTTLDAAAGRTLDAAALPAGLGALGSVVQQGSSGVANWVREGRRYSGLPGRLERAGVEPQFGKGYVAPPAVKAAEKEAKALDTTAEEVLAEKVAPKVEAGARAIREGDVAAVNAENEAFHASPEGQAKLPIPNFVTTAVKKLRGDTEARTKGGVPDPVGYEGKGREVKELFNQEIDRVSLEPVKGAVALTPEEAQAFLSSERHVEVRRLRPQKGPAGSPREPFAPASDLPRAEAHGSVQVGPAEIEAPPLLQQPVKPGAGDWRSPRGIGDEPIQPQYTIPAQRGAAVGLPKRPPPEPLRGNREVALGGPPGKGVEAPPDAAALPPAARAAETPAPTRVQSAKASTAGRARTSKPEPREKGSRGKLAQSLRERGIEQVYVVPREHDAEHTETLLKAIDGFREANPTNRDLIELDKAARLDRDARPMNGVAGGWSKFKGEQSERLDKSDAVMKRAVPNGDTHSAVASFTRPARGELPRMRALRAAADKSGARQELEQTRVPAALEALDKRTAPMHKNAPGTLWGAATNLGDTMMIRGAYPALRGLEGPLGPVGMGKAGRAALARPPVAPPPDEEKGKEYAAWRERYLDQRRPKHRRKGARK